MAPSGEIHAFSEALGQLRASVDSLRGSVDQMRGQWKDQESDASEGRRRLHDKFDGVDRKVDGVIRDVADLAIDVAALKPEVESWKATRQQATGASKLARVLWVIIIALALPALGGVVSLIKAVGPLLAHADELPPPAP